MNKTIKILSIVSTVLGLASTLLGGWAKDKELDAKIDEKVLKAIAEQAQKTEA